MASMPPGTTVHLVDDYRDKLVFAPPSGASLRISVHPDALKAPRDPCTHVVALTEREITWAGALDERMLETTEAGPTETPPRELLGARLCRGSRLWEIVRPGPLVKQEQPLFCVYHGDRPWLIIGELATGIPLGAPMNDERRNPKWWMPLVRATEKEMPDPLDSRIELHHVWSLDTADKIGFVRDAAQTRVVDVIRKYFPGLPIE